MDYRCPHCGELVDTWPDPSAGERQDYIEACPVCHEPNHIAAQWDQRNEDFDVAIQAE